MDKFDIHAYAERKEGKYEKIKEKHLIPIACSTLLLSAMSLTVLASEEKYTEDIA